MILEFSGKNAFLCNFYEHPFRMGGRTYQTGEHAFQSMKAKTREKKLEIATADSPGAAKHLGRRCDLRPDWEEVKIPVMRKVLFHKFYDDSVLAENLLSTRNEFLMEGNTWNDRIWGVCEGTGQNWLGVLLMAHRAELRAT